MIMICYNLLLPLLGIYSCPLIDDNVLIVSISGSGVGYGGGGSYGLGDTMDYHLDDDSPRGHPHPQLQHSHPHSHHAPQSLRRSRSRPSPVIYQTPHGENPYQQPYLPGRSTGLSESPISDNGSADTLTDSELPYPTNPALPLQNGKKES